jgi:hypothetical protein
LGRCTPAGYNAPMMHETTGSVTTYYGVDLASTFRADLITVPLDRRVPQVVSGIDPVVDWYWTAPEGRTRVWFRERAHAERFRMSLFG